MRADASRDALIVSGTDQSVSDILDDIAIFDVDALRGVSFALLPLANAQAGDVAREVTSLIGAAGGGIAGLVHVTPIDRLNAVLVTSMRPAYLTQVRGWVASLDRSGGNGEPQLYVYRVQNGRAADLAAVLRQALGIAGSAAPAASATPAPPGATTALPPPPLDQAVTPGLSAGSSRIPAILTGGLPNDRATPRGPFDSTAAAAGESSIRVTADEANNALVISATPQDYSVIESALQKLDIRPLQVLIDATIAEVDLTNQLSFGLQYYFRSGNFRAVFSPNIQNATTAPSSTSPNGTPTSVIGTSTVFPGFGFLPGANLAVASLGGSAVILNALKQLTHVEVLSSPNLLVLNNQPARLQVGDQVPIETQSATSILTPGAPVVNSIEYRDTGVILNITPRVNAGGLVLLDIAEEVSDVVQTTTSSLDTPTISQRRVTSSVAVRDGQTIALGGLIKDTRTKSNSGIPVLKDIPYLGWLFGTRSDQLSRTELIVMITPHVVRDGSDAQSVTDELRRKLRLTIPVLRGR